LNGKRRKERRIYIGALFPQTKLSQFAAMQPEGIAVEARKLLLERASRGTSNFVMNK